MTATSHPYPVYKSSGVRWADEMPRHFEVLPDVQR